MFMFLLSAILLRWQGFEASASSSAATTASAPQLGPSNDSHPDQDYDDEAVGRPYDDFNTDEADLWFRFS